MSALLGLIGGSGLDQYSQGLRLATTDTAPWGEPSDAFTEVQLPAGRLFQ
ncbi:MAG: hypothetical protein L3J22_02750 [Xanthomonadales bacterium]|nr:hypothetical protein [Xanthomonadales bacterium]